MVYIQRLNRFKGKYILHKRKTHYKPSETFLVTHFISSKQPTVKNSFLKEEPLIILRTTSSQAIICDENITQSELEETLRS